MASAKSLLTQHVSQAIQEVYGASANPDQIAIQDTRKEFDGDYTLVVFPLLKISKKSPEETANDLGKNLSENCELVDGFNVVKGFLNLVLTEKFWRNFLTTTLADETYGQAPNTEHKVLIEFAAPNTNKPLHLGHARNVLLGSSTYRILQKNGHDVSKVNLINDRGIHICKSMLSWSRFGEEKTPTSEQVKGDHLVGEYYVLYGKKLTEEYDAWKAEDSSRSEISKQQFEKEHSKIGADVRQMLLDWESGDESVRTLWEKMNAWVLAGHDDTYEKLDISFDKVYLESETFSLGKELIDEGLTKGTFYQKDDGSVWIDLEEFGLDHKLVLRSNGTSVYMTQDIGTTHLKYEDFKMDQAIFVVGNEQEYHFKALFAILKKLGEPYANRLNHLSYGLVSLPDGRMKTREGTVVDADDLIDEVIGKATEMATERGQLSELKDDIRRNTIRQIAMAALKYFILRVNAKKGMVFNPAESVDMQGQTGPYIQNAYVRIQSVLRKYESEGEIANISNEHTALTEFERTLLLMIQQYPNLVKEAGEQLDPSVIASFAYDLAKSYHRFYHEVQILGADSNADKLFRINLSKLTGRLLKDAFEMLGIEMPDRM